MTPAAPSEPSPRRVSERINMHANSRVTLIAALVQWLELVLSTEKLFGSIADCYIFFLSLRIIDFVSIANSHKSFLEY